MMEKHKSYNNTHITVLLKICQQREELEMYIIETRDLLGLNSFPSLLSSAMTLERILVAS